MVLFLACKNEPQKGSNPMSKSGPKYETYN